VLAPRRTLDRDRRSANGAEIVSKLQRELPGVIPVVVSTDKISLSEHGLSLLYWALRRLLELAGSADAVGA
jgi:hypothetical protein